MNVIVVDTSSWITYLKGESVPSLDSALKEGRAYLSPIVLAELLSSFRSESKKTTFVQFLKELPLCDASFDHWAKVGELRALLSKKGISISTPDAHIAQATLDLDGYLLTEDKVFERINSHVKLKLLSA